jgi:hypothetical protein
MSDTPIITITTQSATAGRPRQQGAAPGINRPTRSIMSYVKVKPVAITKEQMVSAPSLVHWRDVYQTLVPVFKERLAAAAAAAAATSTSTSSDNDPASNNTSNAATPSDDDIIRLLAEWGGDVDIAVGKHREAQAWRAAHFPILRSEVLPTIKTGKLIFHGFDRVGRPVCYYRTRMHDPKAFAPEETGTSVRLHCFD